MFTKSLSLLLSLAFLTSTRQSLNSLGNSAAYCIPTYTYGCDGGEGISSFKFNSISLSENSDCSTNSYRLFSNTIPSVTPGNTYQFNVILLGGIYPEGVSVWIDINHNGVFETAERIFSIDNALDNANGLITIPATATAGPLNLRIVTRFSLAPDNACGQYDFGETEDYQLSVTTSTCQMYTLKSGNWNDTSVWSCNRLPTSTDQIQVKHILTIPSGYNAYAQKLKWDSGTRIIVGNNAKLYLSN